jgi:hypothetical protein
MLSLDTSATAYTFPLITGSVSRQSLGHSIQAELRGRIALGWTLIQPLVIWIQPDDDGGYLINDEVFYVYGEGANIAAAQRDYVQSLIEYFFLVTKHNDAPSVPLVDQLHRFLRQS